MGALQKYIILSDGNREYAVVFDAKLSHVDVAHGIIGESRVSRWSKILTPLEPVAAGFVGVPEMRTDKHLASESLKLGPRAQDEAIIRGEPYTAEPAKPRMPEKR